jgi:hypothetical protein
VGALIGGGFVLLVGLYLTFFADAGGDMRVFGWILVVVGAIGLILWAVLPPMRRPRRRS